MEKLSIFLVTGLSGAGKTVVADWFEDKGFYCVDNMPPSLIDSFVQLSKNSSHMDRIAIIIDVRGGEFFDDLYSALERLKKDPDVELKILFVEASDKALMRRYNESRRNHPLYMGTSGAADSNVIGKERELLSGIRKMADYVVDTTGLRVAQLNNMLDKTFKDDVPSVPFTINLQSFGYKRGLPDCDRASSWFPYRIGSYSSWRSSCTEPVLFQTYPATYQTDRCTSHRRHTPRFEPRSH